MTSPSLISDPRTQQDRRLDAAARRAAKRIGLNARKSRANPSVDNHGGYMLIDAHANYVVAGPRFDLSAQDVIAYCADERE